VTNWERRKGEKTAPRRIIHANWNKAQVGRMKGEKNTTEIKGGEDPAQWKTNQNNQGPSALPKTW